MSSLGVGESTMMGWKGVFGTRAALQIDLYVQSSDALLTFYVRTGSRWQFTPIG